MHLHTRTTALFFLAILCSCQYAFCQTSFRLDKERGHYFITTAVNGKADVRLLVATRLPGMVVGSKLFDSIFEESDFDKSFIPSQEDYSDSHLNNIKRVLHGTIVIGGLRYTGKVFVVEKGSLAVPVHLLKNETDSTANIIRLNFKNRTLEYVSSNSFDASKMHSFKTVEYAPVPIFESTMELADTYGHESTIDGRFIFDIANGTPVFLFDKNIARFLKSNKFTLIAATDKSLNPAGKGIFAGFCKIGERTLNGISIGITDKLYYPGVLGSVGPSFFGNGDVLIDTKNEIILYR